jgi:hypothetical protein
LGLPPDATAPEVRSAFRRLARTYHPDLAGRQFARKFEQITKAYALLKELHTEVARPTLESSVPENGGVDKGGARKFSLSAALRKPAAWYRKRLERLEADKERLRRVAEDARERMKLDQEARVEAVLSRGERLAESLLRRRERETQSVGTHGLALRLMSDIPQIRHLALTHLGGLANRQEIFGALLASLQRWDIDEKTARLVSALPLRPDNHRKLAESLAERAVAMPDILLAHLLQLYNDKAADRELLERYLPHAGAGGVSLILRRWPQGAFVSENSLIRLMSHEDESVLVTLFRVMKQRSVPCPKESLEFLNSKLAHPSLAVRVWAKALLPTGARS